MPKEEVQASPQAEFFQAHPEYYKISTAGVYVKLLISLANSAKDLPGLYLEFATKVENQDLEQMLDLLCRLKIIQKLELQGKSLYYATDTAHKFLEIYQKAHQA